MGRTWIKYRLVLTVAVSLVVIPWVRAEGQEKDSYCLQLHRYAQLALDRR